MDDAEVMLAGHVQELRRGSVVLACLSVLRRPHYGYALLDVLKEAGIEVDGNTLYPLLRRLERQGLLTSAWNTDDARPRKYYRVSPSGERVRERLAAEWAALDASIRALLEGKGT
ncbi:MAG TPA: PadR family transcriptional regulator [Thermoleophilia bacterium]|jgi:PadR family transcriptional regulator, regulatory protein PadR|nr:PadR family transcriptional regulator [Thermoleophilia bacterium]